MSFYDPMTDHDDADRVVCVRCERPAASPDDGLCDPCHGTALREAVDRLPEPTDEEPAPSPPF